MTVSSQPESFTFMHRENFVAKRDAGMNRWDYRGIRWQAERPADGDPPLQVTIECPVCAQKVDVRVHSLADKQRHKKVMAGFSIAGLVILLVGVVLAWYGISMGDEVDNSDPARETYDAFAIVGVISIMVGLTVAWGFYLKRDAQIGVKGGGAGAAGAAKHLIDEDRASAKPGAPAGG